jgi:hypothetical protein
MSTMNMAGAPDGVVHPPLRTRNADAGGTTTTAIRSSTASTTNAASPERQ